MIITQDQPIYQPINIKLNDRKEAQALFGMMEKIVAYDRSGGVLRLSDKQIAVAVTILNAGKTKQVRV